jgi:hypothetical protein
VRLADGRAATHSCESHRGDFNDPFSEAELRGKFRELAGVVLTADGVAAAERAIDRIEEWKDVGALTELLHRYGRA